MVNKDPQTQFSKTPRWLNSALCWYSRYGIQKVRENRSFGQAYSRYRWGFRGRGMNTIFKTLASPYLHFSWVLLQIKSYKKVFVF